MTLPSFSGFGLKKRKYTATTKPKVRKPAIIPNLYLEKKFCEAIVSLTGETCSTVFGTTVAGVSTGCLFSSVFTGLPQFVQNFASLDSGLPQLIQKAIAFLIDCLPRIAPIPSLPRPWTAAAMRAARSLRERAWRRRSLTVGPDRFAQWRTWACVWRAWTWKA